MQINLNGKNYTTNSATNIAELIQELQLQQQRFAVELNQQIVPRSDFAATKLNANDSIEIIHAIGGG